MYATEQDIARCLGGLTAGPITSLDWGPMEFSQSSRWPVQVLDIRLLHEHWSACGPRRAGLCRDVAARELRESLLIPKSGAGASPAGVPAAAEAIGRQLSTPPPPAFRFRARAEAEQAKAPFRLVTIGSHMGSNMEPFNIT